MFLILVSFNSFGQDSSLIKVSIYKTHPTAIGIASFYANKFNGRKTSSGEIFNNDKLTAAHKKLKLGTYVKVRNLKNDSIVIVKVNDRLPQRSKRSIDLSYKAAQQLNFIKNGLTKVEITVLDSLKK
jgi:rare lipoprotein A